MIVGITAVPACAKKPSIYVWTELVITVDSESSLLFTCAAGVTVTEADKPFSATILTSKGEPTSALPSAPCTFITATFSNK